MTNSLNPVGTFVQKTAKQGGGSYTVIGHINCERCNELCEERERETPTKEQRKKGFHHQYVVWCESCGFTTYHGRKLNWK